MSEIALSRKCFDLTEENAELRSQLDVASDDTKRLDWLEKNAEAWLDIRDRFTGENLPVRQTIDAAMKEGK